MKQADAQGPSGQVFSQNDGTNVPFNYADGRQPANLYQIATA
jgi:hypothetical protein